MSSSRTQNLIKSRKLNINNCNSLKRLTAIAYTLCQAQFIMITDSYIEKDGKKIGKVRLLYVDGDKKLCDGCDEMKECASIQAISTDNNHGDVMILCKDCLLEIVGHF